MRETSEKVFNKQFHKSASPTPMASAFGDWACEKRNSTSRMDYFLAGFFFWGGGGFWGFVHLLLSDYKTFLTLSVITSLR